MGGGSSRPFIFKPPPLRVEDPFPTIDPIGIGKGMAQGCQWNGATCQLAIPQGVSASGAKLYREVGSVSRDACLKYSRDIAMVNENKKSFEEVKKTLLEGKYYKDLQNGYCAQLLFDAVDLKGVMTPDKVPQDKARSPTIRPMSDSGSFSSVTKLFIKPSIPFEAEFNGRSYKFPVMTLMHPSPIRIENIQHDAMLTLGDPDPTRNEGLVILVPLAGSMMAGESGAFFNKITRYMTGVLQPDPATGQYEAIDIPTGNDWDVSKIFPGTPGEGGKTFVTDAGYYVWSGRPPLALQKTSTTVQQVFLPDIDYYSWVPVSQTNLRYVMLSKPALVGTFDLQTIRMLPATPVTEALSTMEKTTLSYRTASSCPKSSSPTAALSSFFGREGYENPLASVKLPTSLTAPTIDKCDPFASLPKEPPGKDQMIQAILGILITFGALLAIYFAVMLFTKEKWGKWLADKGTWFGNFVSQFSTDPSKRVPKDKLFEVTAAEEEAERRKEETRRQAEDAAASSGAEARLSAIPGSTGDANPLAAKKRKEAAAKKKAEDEAIEKARLEAEAEAEAKRKADEEAEAKTKAEDEAEAKKKADEEAEAKTKAEDEAEAKTKADEEAEAERKKAQEAAAGTGLFTADDRFRQQAQAEVDRRAAEVEAQREKTEEMRKRVEEREAKEKADAEAEEARIKAAAEEAAASASKAAETQTKRLKKRKVESSDRALPVASETTATTTGETVKVEDPQNILGRYDEAVTAYEASPSDATERKVRGLESQARGVSRNSPALKTRYMALIQRFERAKDAAQKAEDKSEGDLQARITKLRERTDAVKQARSQVISLQLRNPTPIALRGLEMAVQRALERLAVMTQATEAALPILAPEDQTLLKFKINEAKKFYTKEKAASNANLTAISGMTAKGYEIKGGRRNRKRKSTRRYVA